LLALPMLAKVAFFRLPPNSATFDCDDATIAMYNRLAGAGIKADIIAGNLNASGEEFKDIDHVWVLVKVAGRNIAFDWGLPAFDRQHYEGYTVSYAQLEKWVEHDRPAPGAVASAP